MEKTDQGKTRPPAPSRLLVITKTLISVAYYFGLVVLPLGAFLILFLIMSPADIASQIPTEVPLSYSIDFTQFGEAGLVTGAFVTEGSLSVIDPSRWLSVLAVVAILLEAAIVVLGMYYTRKLLTLAIAAKPFAEESYAYLRRLGSLIISVAVLHAAAATGFGLYLKSTGAIPNGISIQLFDIRLDTLIAGLLVIVLASVFQRGARLEREDALTV